jgi:uncharacterized protein YaeQ
VALPTTRLEYRIALADAERRVDATETVIVGRHPSETAEHVTLRVLAWCLAHRPGLAFGPGICDGDAADLWAHDPGGAVAAWVECGAAEADRLRKVMAHHGDAEVHAVLADPRRADELVAAVASWARRPRGRGDLVVWSVAPELVAALAARESRRQRWAVTLVEGHAYIDVDGDALDGELTCVRPLAR